MVSTITLYRSPVRLVEYAAEATAFYSAPAIGRARKRLVAEISLAGDEILIDDISYSRNDVTNLLDGLTDESWRTHTIIYQQKGLLHFLEKETFSHEALRKADAYLYNAPFVQAVSPYFAQAFNTVAGSLIKADNFEELALLLSYKGYILPEHSSEAYQKIRIYLNELSYTVRNLSWEKFIGDESHLHFVFSPAWQKAVNSLPPEFVTVRDELVEQLINVVLRFQYKATWYYLHQVLVNIKQVETNDFNRSEIVRIDDIIYRNSRQEAGQQVNTQRSKSEVKSGRAVWWVIWVILMVVRAATCNDNNKSSYNFNDPPGTDVQEMKERSGLSRSTERKNEKTLLLFLDSLSQTKKLTIQSLVEPIKTGDQPFGVFADLPSQSGPCAVTVANRTSFNCVMVYFDGPARPGSVYQGSVSHTSSVYIKTGERFSFRTEPGMGGFYFLFGEEWGRLKDNAELPLFNYNNYTVNPKIYVYEFFKSKVPVRQKYLSHSLWLAYPSSEYNDGSSTYLNHPDSASGPNVEMILTQKDKTFFVEANGGLAVKEEKSLIKQKAETENQVGSN